MLRSLARSVAHENMKKKGFIRVNKKNGKTKESYFSVHWREFLKGRKSVDKKSKNLKLKRA